MDSSNSTARSAAKRKSSFDGLVYHLVQVQHAAAATSVATFDKVLSKRYKYLKSAPGRFFETYNPYPNKRLITVRPLIVDMKDADTTFDMRSHKLDLDENAAQGDVMPDTWNGHARIIVRDSDLPDTVADRAIRKSIQLADKKGVTPETAAKRMVKVLSEKLE
jgi:uncharacterized protein YdbL (DUF1318 family)